MSNVNCIAAILQAEKVHELNEEIGKLLAKAEQLGAEGNVDEAQKVLQEVEKVRTRKKDAEVRKACLGGTSSSVECDVSACINTLSSKPFNVYFLFSVSP